MTCLGHGINEFFLMARLGPVVGSKYQMKVEMKLLENYMKIKTTWKSKYDFKN